MNFWHAVTAAIITSTAASIMMAIGGMTLIPHVPDLYNELYNDARLQRPESTVMFFAIFPILQILLAAAFLATTRNLRRSEVKVVQAMLPLLLSCLFTIGQIYRLGVALNHF